MVTRQSIQNVPDGRLHTGLN